MRAKHFFASLLSVSAVAATGWAGAKDPAGEMSRAAWMGGRYGVMVHWCYYQYATTPQEAERTVQKPVDDFDLEGFLRDFDATGADWLLFPIGQNAGCWASPNPTLAGFVGAWRFPRRDLVLEIARAVKARGKRFLCYLPVDCHQKPEIQKALAWEDRPEFYRRWSAAIADWAKRFGRDCDGWWFDGANARPFPEGFRPECLRPAALAGNPDAVCSFAKGVPHCGGNPCCAKTGRPPEQLNADQQLSDYCGGETASLVDSKIRLNRHPGPDEFWMPTSACIPGTKCLNHSLLCVDAFWGGYGAYPTAGWLLCDFRETRKEMFDAARMRELERRGEWPEPVHTFESLSRFVGAFHRAGGAVTLNLGVNRAGRMNAKSVALIGRLRAERGRVLFRPEDVERVPHTWPVEDGGISNVSGRVAGVRPIWLEGAPYKGRETRVFAWYGLPKDASRDRPVPAMVLVHGGGGTAFASWVKTWNDRGYAAIAMDTNGGAPRGERGDAHPRHPWSGPYGWCDRRGYDDLALRDQWPYHAILAIARSHSFIRSLPEVDPERTGLTGISWGGNLATSAAGVDRRFKFVAPVYGCGWHELNPAWSAVAPIAGGGAAYGRWLNLWDPKHFVGGTTAFQLRCNGDCDKWYPMEMTCRTAAALPWSVRRALSIRHKMRHGHPPSGDPKEIAAFADYCLKGGPRPPAFIRTDLANGVFTASYEDGDADRVRAAELWTLRDDSKPSEEREWKRTPVALDRRGSVSVPVDAGTKCCYLNLISESGLVISSLKEAGDFCRAPTAVRMK